MSNASKTRELIDKGYLKTAYSFYEKYPEVSDGCLAPELLAALVERMDLYDICEQEFSEYIETIEELIKKYTNTRLNKKYSIYEDDASVNYLLDIDVETAIKISNDIISKMSKTKKSVANFALIMVTSDAD